MSGALSYSPGPQVAATFIIVQEYTEGKRRQLRVIGLEPPRTISEGRDLAIFLFLVNRRC